MTVTLTERFLKITMNYHGESGHKGYQSEGGNTHTIHVYNITETRQIKKIGVSSYSQTTTPISTITGKQPDVVKIEGKLCMVKDVTTYLAGISGRACNTLFNVFLPCSILTGSSSECPEINGEWIVDTFKIKRNLQKRDIVAFELILYKWYGG